MRANSRASTLSRTSTTVSTLTQAKPPGQASASPQANTLVPSRPERPYSRTAVVLGRLDEAQARRKRERSEWAGKAEERRLDKLKAHNAAEELQSLGQKQATLVEKMIQDLFALTPEWEMRRMKARAVSFHLFSSYLYPHNVLRFLVSTKPVVPAQEHIKSSPSLTREPGSGELDPCNTTYSYSFIFPSPHAKCPAPHISRPWMDIRLWTG